MAGGGFGGGVGGGGVNPYFIGIFGVDIVFDTFCTGLLKIFG